jgi:hypothetical protein
MSLRRLAWGLFALYAALQAAIVGLVVGYDTQWDQLIGLALLGYASIGTLVAARFPRNAVGWVLLGVALAFGAQTLGEVYVALPSAPAREYVGWAGTWSWFVWMLLTAVVLPLVFPDGRVLTRRWRGVLWLAAVAFVLSAGGEALRPGDLDLSVKVDNPFGVRGAAGELAAASRGVGSALIVAAFVLAIASLGIRFRRSSGSERQQLKWFALVGLITMVALLISFAAVAAPGGWRDVVGAVGWFTFLFAALIATPVATGIAILRHRLYDIDLVINRTLVYGSLTAALVGAYLGIVLVLRLVLSPLTGESDLAVAASTLTVAALFRPLRSRIQQVVDHRFYRARYDAARTLETFSSRLRDELDLDTLGSDLRGVVRDTMQPAHVSLWLRERPS